MPQHSHAVSAPVGVWRRALLVQPDGTRDTDSEVSWIQSRSLYGDLRQPARHPRLHGVRSLSDLGRDDLVSLAAQEAFAGELHYRDGWYTWHREIDFQPPGPLPDTGSLTMTDGTPVERKGPPRPDDVIVEEGRHVAYREHWQAMEGFGTHTAAARLRGPLDGLAGILLRVNSWFLYARGRRQPLTGTEALADRVREASSLAAARELVDCEFSLGRVVNGQWQVLRSTLPHRVGRRLPVLPTSGRKDRLRVRDVDATGTPVPLLWEITDCEGQESLLPTGSSW